MLNRIEKQILYRELIDVLLKDAKNDDDRERNIIVTLYIINCNQNKLTKSCFSRSFCDIIAEEKPKSENTCTIPKVSVSMATMPKSLFSRNLESIERRSTCESPLIMVDTDVQLSPENIALLLAFVFVCMYPSFYCIIKY